VLAAAAVLSVQSMLTACPLAVGVGRSLIARVAYAIQGAKGGE
jgi:hypothetical protein